MNVFWPVHAPGVAVAHGGRRDAVAVRASVRLGDREGHLLAGGEARQPARALRLGPVAGDDLAADRGGDEHGQQRTARRRGLLAHDGELGDPRAAAAEALGEVDGEEAVLGERVPQLVDLLAGAHLRGEVLVPEVAGDVGDRAAQQRVLVALREVHADLLRRM